MPMHCSANVGPDGDAAVFFGLSGTGKTTLSADPVAHADRRRRAWLGRRTASSISKAAATPRRINLSARGRAGDLRHHPALRHGAGERRARPQTRVPDFDDGSADRKHPLRLSARLHPQRQRDRAAPAIPKNVIMLTADAFGVMPPIAKLTPAQAMYHFLSGYTAKVAGTEKGVTEPEATFSTCFGAPFMPRHPAEYGNLLRDLIAAPRRRLLAGQHRLDRRRLRRRQAHADQGDARPARRGAGRLAERRPNSAPTRISASRCRWRAGGVDAHSRPALDLGRQGGL